MKLYVEVQIRETGNLENTENILYLVNSAVNFSNNQYILKEPIISKGPSFIHYTLDLIVVGFQCLRGKQDCKDTR